MSVLIIKTGSTMRSIGARFGDFEDWFSRHLPGADLRVVAVHLDEPLPPVSGVERALITGSPHMVTERRAWSEQTAEWIRSAHAQGVPLLGVCYGHQLIAHALGGEVDWNPHGRQIGLTRVQLHPAANNDALLAPFASQLDAFTTHQQSVVKLPPGAQVLAHTSKDPHHAYRVGERTWGVQFHPEFDAEIMAAYLAERREQLEAEAIDVNALVASLTLQPTSGGHSQASSVLQRFANLSSPTPGGF